MSARDPIAIIGGGIIGLTLGWRLAGAGARVVLLERGEAGQGASHAAAGMLAPGIETEPGEDPLIALSRESLALWPDFAAELTERSGIEVGLRREGTIEIALTRDDAARLARRVSFQRSRGAELHWLSPAEARAREPHLGPRLAGGVFSPHDHQVDNRRVTAALRRLFLAAGGELREHTPVEAVVITEDRVSGVRLSGGDVLPASQVVLAAGAWSAGIGGIPPALRPPVRPIKGQMLSLRMDPHSPLLRHVLWTPKVYLVPRGDGRLLIGATTEERGFDPTLTAGGVFSLLESAWRAIPAIEELAIDEMWVGFRPGSRDDAPILGPTPVRGLIMATGHHRNGILLAPITAALLLPLLLEGRTDPRLLPFRPDRFSPRERVS